MNELKKLNKTMSYEQMAKICGLSRQRIHYLAQLPESQIMNCSLETFIMLKEKLGVDFAAGINYKLFKNRSMK